jgi:hypothetical protein
MRIFSRTVTLYKCDAQQKKEIMSIQNGIEEKIHSVLYFILWSKSKKKMSPN